MSHDTEEWMQNLKKKQFAVSKMTKMWWILTWTLKILHISTSTGSFCAKYIAFNLKKYGGVIFHDTEEWCEIWKKTDLRFGKWHDELGKFSKRTITVWKMTWRIRQIFQENLKVSNFGLWWDHFIQSRTCMSLKTLSYVSWQWRMMQNWKRNWLAVPKLTPKFDEFWPKHSNVSNIWTIMDSFWRKYLMFELKKYIRVMFDGTEGWCKIWRKTDLCFQKWHEEFGKFSQAEK